MRTRLLVRLIWLIALLPMAAMAEVRLAIISEAAVNPAAELLAVELSRQPVVLLERAEIDRVFAEHQLGTRGLAEAVQVGRLLRADGVLVFSQISQSRGNFLACRLVAVATGVVLDSHLAPSETKDPG